MSYVQDKSQTVINCGVGQTIKLSRPQYYKGVNQNLDTKVGVNGFRVLYPELGEIIESSTDPGKTWIKYKHKKSGTQVIEFTSVDLGTHVFTAVIQGITVHDHASIPMGGPAFATYYSEPNVTTTEEGS
jgi:hypothetical protein